MEANYMNRDKDEKQIEAGIGDVVMVPGNIRGIVIEVRGTFVKILAIGTSKKSGDTFVLNPRYIHDFLATDCSYLEKQILNL